MKKVFRAIGAVSGHRAARLRRAVDRAVEKIVPGTAHWMESLEGRRLLSVNPIVAENQLPGTPQSQWDVSGAGDPTLQGFATDISVNQGQTVSFKITDTAKVPYHIDVYRMGYYQGNGARLVATIASSQTIATAQPSPMFDPSTALVDAGNWSVSASWQVPAAATSGVYFARLVRNDTGGASMVPFIVRNDSGHSQILFQTSDATWEAYNAWGGYSLYQYTGNTAGPGYQGAAYAVSYNRPFTDRGVAGGLGATNWFMYDEYPMVRFLEKNGYDVSYFTDVDADRNGSLIKQHQIWMSTGHDEYWSGNEFNNVMAARDAGVNLAFFSGNEVFWKTRLANSIDGSNTQNRTLVCYKETHGEERIDPLDLSQGIWTGSWMDPTFSPPADGGRPQNQLTGTLFTVNRGANDVGTPITVPYSFSQLRFWRNTSVAQLQPGQTATLGDYELGYEWDENVDNGFQPAGLINLSSTTQNVTQKFIDYGNTTAPGVATHSFTLYRAASGALVFGAGTVQYDWGLDGTHDDTNGHLGFNSTPVPALQQATVNLFADMNVQPQTLQDGLVLATASTDSLPPTSRITSPAAGGTFQTGIPVTIAGSAVDAGGGVVAGVEVSVDGGRTWHPAQGTANWTYTWVPDAAGQVQLMTRATDDSANVETPTGGVTVNVTYAPVSRTGLIAEYGFNEGTGAALTDSSGKNNNGTILNAAWANGLFGKALSFNGTNSWVTIPNASSLSLTTGMTLEAWVKPSSLSDWGSVVMKESSNGLVYGMYADDGAGQPPSGYVHVGQSDDKVSALSSALPLNAWSNIAVTYDGSTLSFYLNGTKVGSEVYSGSIATSSGVLRIGGDSIWGEYFNGLIDQLRVYNRALNQAEIRSDMSTPVGGTLETTPPTVTLTTPAANATLSGVTTLAVNASDNVYVEGVQYLLDGQPLGALVTTAPYSLSWDTRRVANGTHTLSAVAYDAAGNEATAAVESVTVSNAPDTSPPAVQITYPTGNFSTAGAIIVNATASDNISVASVQLKLNGVNVGAPLTGAPYRFRLDGTEIADGTYSLTAVATDSSGNVTSSDPLNVTIDHTPPAIVSSTPAANSFGVTTATSLAVTFSEPVQPGTIQISLRDPSGNVIPCTFSYDDATNTATFSHGTVALDPLTTYTASVTATDLAGNAMKAAYAWSFSTSTAIVGATMWEDSSVPTIPSANDTNAVEVGVKFQSDIDGTITGLRFYKGGPNTGTHVAHLWAATGQLLATATFTGESASGWQQVTFAQPVAISANTTYVASYYAPVGGYAVDGDYFGAAGVNSGPLHAPSDAAAAGNGVFAYAAGGAFPTASFGASNYWVDVVFNSASQSTIPPAVTSSTPGNNAAGVAPNASLSITFSKSVQPGTISFQLKDAAGDAVAGSLSYDAGTNTATFLPLEPLSAAKTYTAVVSGAADLAGNTMSGPYAWTFTTSDPSAPPVISSVTPASGSTGVAKGSSITATFDKAVDEDGIDFALTDGSGNSVPGVVNYDDESNTATFVPSAALSPGTRYTATVSGAADLAGNEMTAPYTWSFTTASSAPAGTTLWGASTVPAVASANDTNAVEVGVRFKSDTAGYVTGLRFYKGGSNTGTHVAHLWAATGQLLATATFTGESASGWQQVTFAQPVAIAANTTYVASYFAPAGGYAYTGGYFTGSGVDSGSLHALSDAAAGGNGVYVYGSSGGFPTSSFSGTNYWVDVAFATTVADTTPPAVTAQAPAPGATGVPTSATPSVTFSEPVQAGKIQFSVKTSIGDAVAGSLAYDSSTNTAKFTPSSPLALGTSYTVTVSGAQDNAGNAMAPVSWSFTVPAVTSIWDDSAAPSTPSANDGNAVEVGVKFRADSDGHVTGLRFYKGAGNTGTHVGHLWDASGNLLATVAFTNETSGGWQEATFSSPVQISAGKTYVVSYFAPSGHYAADAAYFTSSGVDNGPLHALADGASGGNGVYAYGASGTFPNGSFHATNYWVDALFQPSALDLTPPTVTDTTPVSASSGLATTLSASATFSEAVQAGTISFTLRDASGNPVAGTVSYDNSTHTATFTPSAALAGGATYTATVSGAKDIAGNAISAPVTWAFSTMGQWTQTSAADFDAGTLSNAVVTNTAGGELQLAPAFFDDFASGLNAANWDITSWTSQGGGPTSVSAENGALSVAGAETLSAQAYTDAVVTGRVNFAAAAFEHFGLATDLTAPAGNDWAIFSTSGTADTLYARVDVDGAAQQVSLGALPVGYHTYTVQSVSGGYQFYIDGVLQTTIGLAAPSTVAMRAAMSSFSSSAIQADSVTLGAGSGSFVSSVFDAGRVAAWGAATWTATVPAGTSVLIETRSGNSATPDTSWSSWQTVSGDGTAASPGARYLQYRITLVSADPVATPVVSDVSLLWS